MKYDIAIIGGGPAGYSAAFEAVSHGLSAVLFEKSLLGGTCLNRGCVPTKFLLHTGEMFSRINSYEAFGISAEARLDLAEAQKKNYSIVDTLRESLMEQLEGRKITVVSGADAVIRNERLVEAGGECFEADNILIATGSVPSLPFTEGAVTSDEILRMKKVPEAVTVLGGGVVATEFAWLLACLGSKVTVKIRGERLLRKWDKELALGIQQMMKKAGISVRIKCGPDEMRTDNGECVLSALGRKPRLPQTDIFPALGEDGGIIADDRGRTSIAGIFAAGDVTSGSVQLAHAAMEQGRRAVRCIAHVETGAFPAIVSCIYTTPEAASVGFTEESAKNAGIGYVTAKQPMSYNARTMISATGRSFIKLVAEKNTGRIIGAQLLCERAGDIASELALAVNNGMTADELRSSLRPHPSFCEAITEAAEIICEKINGR